MKTTTIAPSSITVTTRPDGITCLNMPTLAGTFDVEISAEVWKKLGEDAQWFAKMQPSVLSLIDARKK